MAEAITGSEAQTTEITFKTISQDVFKITFPITTTIGEVKAKIFNDRGGDLEVDRQKLIYNGKVLTDEQVLKDVSVDDKKYIIVMASKKKVEQPVAAQSSSATETAKASTPVAEPTPTPSASVAPIVTAAPTITPEQEETITMVCAMGYSREEVVRALRSAFWNADRAVEYLISGIPDVGADVAENLAEANLLEDQPMGDEENPLTFLRESPQFAQLCQLVRSQPEMLAQVLSQIDSTNPDLMQIIRNNQEAFLQMLNESTEGDAPAVEETGAVAGAQPAHQAGHLTIAVTEADRNALERLQSMGFPEQLVIEAYFACDKDEGLAVNYILSRIDEVSNDE